MSNTGKMEGRKALDLKSPNREEPDYARRLKRKKPSRRDIWHLDEVVITIAGQKHWLWRAVDQDSYVLDVIVQSRRSALATHLHRLNAMAEWKAAARVAV